MSRISSRWPDLLILVALISVASLVGWWARRPEPPRSVGTSLDGLRPGISYDEMVRVLGPPTCQGHLLPAESYAEYGSATLTWNGHPSVAFDSNGRARAVLGRCLRVSGLEQPIQVGDAVACLQAAHLSKRLGAQVMEHHNTPAADSTEYNVDCGVLVVTTDSMHITHMELTEDSGQRSQ